MPSVKLHQCVQDVMAQGHDEDSAYAICNSQIHERHRDFQRIYDEFCNYYKDTQKGEREYRDWLNALHLDETVEYGRAQESFRWAKDMLSFIREDADNKYYKVVVGFPIKSMNGNVYKERDLIAAALTLKGTHPSLNHKDEYWFSPTNPRNHWGTLTTEAAKYEDGAVEAILKVPKTAICPICDGAKMTELIDNKRIVNVSLEGGCSTERYGECEGFTFNEKGFTLLTTDVLPGIPMARIFPLEHIMVEALQSSTSNQPKGEKKRLKIPAKVKESGTEQTSATVYDNPMSSTSQGPSGSALKGNLVDVSQQTSVQGPDPTSSKPEGIWQTSIGNEGKPIPHEKWQPWLRKYEQDMNACMKQHMTDGESEDEARQSCMNMTEQDMTGCMKQHMGDGESEEEARQACMKMLGEATYPWDQCISDRQADGYDMDSAKAICGKIKAQNQALHEGKTGTPGTMDKPDILQPNAEMPRVDSHTGPDSTSKPNTHLVMPEGDTSANDVSFQVGKPRPEIQAPYKSGTFPSLEENVARIKAEMKAKSLEEQSLLWQQKYNEVYEQLRMSKGKYDGLTDAFNKLNERSLHAESAKKEAELKYNEQCGLVTDLKHQLDRTTKEQNEVTEKYNKLLKTSLELNQKWTKADEDYLDMAKKYENLQDKFAQARKDAKRIVRIKTS